MIVCYRCKNYDKPEGIAGTCRLDGTYIELYDKPFCPGFVPSQDKQLSFEDFW